ncbi:hypothetical protein D3C84_1191730 [compost metagenome]
MDATPISPPICLEALSTPDATPICLLSALDTIALVIAGTARPMPNPATMNWISIATYEWPPRKGTMEA